jgi:hypothetical protein
MRMCVLFAALLLSACAAAPKPVVFVPREDNDALVTPRAPLDPGIRLVVSAPRASRYQYVGRVSGVADLGEWVDTARRAHEDLQRKARALRADVIKIDRVVAPDEGARGRRTLLAGRAYRATRHRQSSPSQ